MKAFALVLSTVLVALVAGCDSMYGPAFLNETNQPVRIEAQFFKAPPEIILQPHQATTRLAPGDALESFVVFSDGSRRVVGAAELHSLAKAIPATDELVVLHKDHVEVISLKQAAKDHMLDQEVGRSRCGQLPEAVVCGPKQRQFFGFLYGST